MSQAFATRGGYHGAGGGGVSIQTPTAQYPPFGQTQQQSAGLTYMPRQNRRGNAYRGPQPAGYNSNMPHNRSASVGYGRPNRFADLAPAPTMAALNPEWVEAEKELYPDGPPIAVAKPPVAVVEQESAAVLPPNAYGRALNAFASNGSGGANRSTDLSAAPVKPQALPPQARVPPNTPFYAESLAKEQDRLDSLARGLNNAAAEPPLRNSAANPDWISAELTMQHSQPPPNFESNVISSSHFVPPTTPSAGTTAVTTTAAGAGGITSSPYCGGPIVIQGVTRNGGSLTDTETATAPGGAATIAFGSGNTKKMITISEDEFKHLVELNKKISDGYTQMVGILSKLSGPVSI